MRWFARTTEVSVEKYTESIAHTKADLLAIEEPLEIRIAYFDNGVPKASTVSLTMRTPGNDASLVLGFLFAEGIITSMDQVSSVEDSGIMGRDKPVTGTVTVHLHEDAYFDLAQMQRNFFSTSSCGVCGRLTLHHLPEHKSHPCKQSEKPKNQLNAVPLRVLYALTSQLDQAQHLFRHTGSMHATALFDVDGQLLYLCEDVGRHNAMDKLVGQALQNNLPLPLTDKLVLFSGRVSYELVQKAIMAGIPFLASIGAPSSLAVEIARAYDLTLVGFLRDRRFNVYAGSHRISNKP